MQKKPHAADNTICFEARRAEQAEGHIMAGQKWRQKLHDVSGEKRCPLESMESGETSHVNVKVEKVVMQDSESRQSLARVGILNPKADTIILMKAMTKYCHLWMYAFRIRWKCWRLLVYGKRFFSSCGSTLQYLSID